jgi:hypothetical protein
MNTVDQIPGEMMETKIVENIEEPKVVGYS